MITYVKLPDDIIRPLPFYLAMEEWLAINGPEGESFFFMWQVEPTVIFGRNQQIDSEVNIDYCRSHGIHFYRRKSGGGCVFADMDNIMFSYITPSKSVQTTFNEYTERVAAMLRELSLDAAASGRNDVTIGGRKVSGNAFYHIPGRSIVHGTMLFSTNMEHMLNAITPSKSKLESKKVKSVASHITTIAEHRPDLSIEDFKAFAASRMSEKSITLTPGQVKEIEEFARPYFTERWIYGRSSGKSMTATRRIEGVGEFHISMTLDAEHRISDINFQGDFFPLTDLDTALFNHLKGIQPTTSEITRAVIRCCPTAISPIAKLTLSDLIDLIILPVRLCKISTT